MTTAMGKVSLFCVTLLLLVGCSPVTLTGAWTDPSYQGGRIRHTLVLGVAKGDLMRRLFEDALAAELESYGVKARVSYPLAPAGQPLEKEQLFSRMHDLGVDFVLVTKVIGKREEQVIHTSPGFYHPRFDPYYAPGAPFHRNWHGYYWSSYEYVHQPAYVTEYRVLTLECHLYRVETDQLVWAAQLEATLQENREKVAEAMAELIADRLSQAGLI